MERRHVNVVINVHGLYEIYYGQIKKFTTRADYKSLHTAPINYSTLGFDKVMLIFIYICRILEKVPIEMILRLFHDNSTNKIADFLFKYENPTSRQDDLCERLYEFFNIKSVRSREVKLKDYAYDYSESTFPETLPSYNNDVVEIEAPKLIYNLGQAGVGLEGLKGSGIFVTDDFILHFEGTSAFAMNVIVEYLENTGLIFADYTRAEKTPHSIVLRYSKFQNIMQCKYYIAWTIQYTLITSGNYSHLIYYENVEGIHEYLFNILISHLLITLDKAKPDHAIIKPAPHKISFLCYADDTTDFQILEVRPDGELQSITPETEPFNCINTIFEGEDLNDVFERERYGGNSKVFGLNEDAFIAPFMDRLRTCISEDAARRPPGEYCFNTFLSNLQKYFDRTTIQATLDEGNLPEGVETINHYTKLKVVHSKMVATLLNTTNENIINFISSNNENSIMIFDNSCASVLNLSEDKKDKVFEFDPRDARGKTKKNKKNKYKKTKKNKKTKKK